MDDVKRKKSFVRINIALYNFGQYNIVILLLQIEITNVCFYPPHSH